MTQPALSDVAVVNWTFIICYLPALIFTFVFL